MQAFSTTQNKPFFFSTVDWELVAYVILEDGRLFGGVSLYYDESLLDFMLLLVYVKDCGVGTINYMASKVWVHGGNDYDKL